MRRGTKGQIGRGTEIRRAGDRGTKGKGGRKKGAKRKKGTKSENIRLNVVFELSAYVPLQLCA